MNLRAFMHAIRVALALIAAAFALSTRCAAADEGAPPIDGHFALSTLDGKDVTDADFRGKWLLIYFGYTFCPDVCPTTLNQIGLALDALGAKAKDFQSVFITVDPARDSVQVMKEYLKSFDPRILGLRGQPDDIEAAAKSFHVYYRPRSLGNGQYTVDHSSYIYAIDPAGKFAALLQADLPGHSLAQALERLDAKEAAH
ncbi:MAG TPA: SCO family protein [Rhizomicrobium sp.]|nr:SCO family protein [Rhizomicrobium sp.]